MWISTLVREESIQRVLEFWSRACGKINFNGTYLANNVIHFVDLIEKSSAVRSDLTEFYL